MKPHSGCAVFLERKPDGGAWFTRLTGSGRLVSGRRAVADALEAVPDRMPASITGASLGRLAATAEEVVAFVLGLNQVRVRLVGLSTDREIAGSAT